MIRPLDQHQFLWLRYRRNQLLQLCPRSELIPRPTQKQLGPGAALQKRKIVGTPIHRRDRSSQRDQSRNPRIRTRRLQPDRRPKRKPRKNNRHTKCRRQPLDRRADIGHLANSIVMLACTQADAAKIEPQHGKSKPVQRLHRVKDRFGVHCPAEQRVRMTNHRTVRCVLCAGIEQRLELPGGSIQKKRFD